MPPKPLPSQFQWINYLRSKFFITDPSVADQWYLHNPLGNGMDLNVTAAWEMGAWGQNVTVAIIDDGVDASHPDLKGNMVSNEQFVIDMARDKCSNIYV
jgi:subtilisin family serine protease